MADRLISADVLKSRVLQWQLQIGQDSTWCVLGLIDSTPTIEAEPIKHGVIELTYEEYGELCSCALADEPLKHGRWKDVEPTLFRDRFATCSVCGVRQLLDKDNFCPNCGARMDGGEDGNTD